MRGTERNTTAAAAPTDLARLLARLVACYCGFDFRKRLPMTRLRGGGPRTRTVRQCGARRDTLPTARAACEGVRMDDMTDMWLHESAALVRDAAAR